MAAPYIASQTTYADRIREEFLPSSEIQSVVADASDTIFGRVKKTTSSYADRLNVPIQTGRYNAGGGTGWKDVYGDGNHNTYENMVWTPAQYLFPVDYYLIDRLIASRRNGAVGQKGNDLLLDTLATVMDQIKRRIDMDIVLPGSGVGCLGRITSGANSATQTVDWVNGTATYSGWSGCRFLEADMKIVLVNASNYAAGNNTLLVNAASGYVHTVSSVDHANHQIVLASSVNTSSGGPYYIFLGNTGVAAGTSNNWLYGLTNFQTIASASNPTAPRHGGKFCDVSRTAAKRHFNGIRLDGSHFGGSAGTAKALTEAILRQLPFKASLMFSMNGKWNPDVLTMNSPVFDQLYEDVISGNRIYTEKPSDVGFNAKAMRISGIAGDTKIEIKDDMPDNTIYALKWEYLGFQYLPDAELGWIEENGTGKWQKTTKRLSYEGVIGFVGDFHTTLPPAAGICLVDARQTAYYA